MSAATSHWEAAFQLAHFIVPDRSRAYAIVAGAIEKLTIQRSRERRRAYWRGRKSHLKIRRISRPETDTLQWLVLFEAEAFEREIEAQGRPTEVDMVIRYIKHLALLTTGISSFYVNVGLNRLLRNYSTPEVQEAYELVTQDYPAADEYRRVKARTMSALAARFERFIKARTAEYGELRFEGHADNTPWVSLVERCLEAFAPWSASADCLQGGDELQRAGSRTTARRAGFRTAADWLETTRCHWFMHSACFGSLAQQLGFDLPRARLRVPQFFADERGGPGSDSRGPERAAAPLTHAEIAALQGRSTSAQARRRAIRPQALKIVAHGVVRARLDPAENQRREFAIPEGTRLLEVRTDVAGNELLLAVHWIDYTEFTGIAGGEYSIRLPAGRELHLEIVPARSQSDGEEGALVVVKSRSRSLVAGAFNAIGSVMRTGRSAGAPRPRRFAIVAVVLAVFGWLATSVNYRSKLTDERNVIERMSAQIASQKTAISSLERKPPPTVRPVARYAFALQAPRLRGAENPQEPIVAFAPGDSMVMIEIPVLHGEHGLYRVTLSSFLEEHERLRETSLQPIRRGNEWRVEFALPAALVANDTHYLIAVSDMAESENAGSAARFLFKVRK